MAIELGLPLKLDALLNALNIGQRKGYIHSALEDAELTLKAVIKMLWLKDRGLNDRAKYLSWYETVHSREYDYLSLKRLDQVLIYYKYLLNNINQC